jgi:glycolate oxidase
VALSGTVLTELARILGADGVFTSREARLTYEADMHTLYKGEPDAVVLPRSTEQVRDVLRLCRR